MQQYAKTANTTSFLLVVICLAQEKCKFKAKLCAYDFVAYPTISQARYLTILFLEWPFCEINWNPHWLNFFYNVFGFTIFNGFAFYDGFSIKYFSFVWLSRTRARIICLHVNRKKFILVYILTYSITARFFVASLCEPINVNRQSVNMPIWHKRMTSSVLIL